MKVTSLTVVKGTRGGGTGFVRETREQRSARVRAFFAAPSNAVLIALGPILSIVQDGQSWAGRMIAGETLDLSGAEIAPGLVVATGSEIGLGNVPKWGCPICRSAHGTGSGVSPEQDAGRLARNQFYFRPSDGALFSISDTCFSGYVKAQGLASKHVTSLEAYQASKGPETAVAATSPAPEPKPTRPARREARKANK